MMQNAYRMISLIFWIPFYAPPPRKGILNTLDTIYIVLRYKKIGYNIDILRQTACLVINPIKINSFAL